MGQPYIGEIRMFGGNFPPAGWMFCQGQLLAISEFDTLFNLIGTTYGGDGQSTFALPDLRGRLPIHQGTSFQGNSFTLAQTGGAETVTLTVNQIPSHTHPLLASTNQASSFSPTNQVVATTQSATITAYGIDGPFVTMLPASVGTVGGSQPHDNFQPYLCVDFIISLFGIFPSQT
jgi:microcystin-dependent protein